MTKNERAKNLSDQAIESIAAILDGWSGKLTWELLLDAVEHRLHQRYVRQTLSNHARISAAFRHRKTTLSASGGPKKTPIDASPELAAALERIRLLEGENQRLTMENNRFIEQFIRWSFNASSRGIDKNFLSQPLPKAHRDRTKVTMEEISRRSQ